jgi:hypothetical protein
MTPDAKKFRWTEQRASRFATMVVSGAVVIADVVLMVVFARAASSLPGGWRAHWYIPAGILLVFAFALRRFLQHLALFRAEE